MTPEALAGHVLDVPALINLGMRRTAYMPALVTYARDRGHTLAVPAMALARAAAQLDTTGRTELAWTVEMPHLVVLPLGAYTALTVGEYAADHLAGDVVTGHVAHIALERGWPVVTSTDAVARWLALGIEAQPLP